MKDDRDLDGGFAGEFNYLAALVLEEDSSALRAVVGNIVSEIVFYDGDSYYFHIFDFTFVI